MEVVGNIKMKIEKVHQEMKELKEICEVGENMIKLQRKVGEIVELYKKRRYIMGTTF